MAPRTPEDLRYDIQRATTILELFTDPKKGRDVKMLIPPSVLKEAHGIVFIRLYKVGFMVSAKSGTGVIIARLSDGSWSAPSGVSIRALGFGHQAGGQVIDSIIVMNYRAAVKAFYDGGGQLQLGVGASLAAGPFGRAADVAASASSTTHIAATYAYSASKGLYAGYTFEGSKISERPNTNSAYYGKSISAKSILTGGVAPPQDAEKLYTMLTDLDAGPRPGLPFAPQKTQNMPPQMTNPPSPSPPSPPPQQQQQQQKQQQPQQQKNDEGGKEPPPPYEEFDPSTEQESSSPNVNTIPHVSDKKQSHGDQYEPPHSYEEKNPDTYPMNQSGGFVVAIYDYTADRTNDLSFKVGDRIRVTQRLEDRQTWWEGEIGDKRGFFPANYTKEITE